MEREASKLFGKSKILSYLELGRFWNGLVCGFLVVLGMNLLVNPPLLDQLLLIVAFVVIYMAATAINDIYDYSVDKINMPYRPLQSGRVTINEAWAFSIIFYALGLLVAYSFNMNIIVCAIAFVVTSALYSLPPVHFVRRGFLAQLELSLSTIVIPLYTGFVYSVGSLVLPTNLLFILLSIGLLFSSIVIIKDFKDVDGDRKSGKNSAVVRLGEKKSLALSLTGTLVFYPLTIFLMNTLIQNVVYVVLAVAIMLKSLHVEYTVLKTPESAFTKIRMLFFSYILLSIITAKVS